MLSCIGGFKELVMAILDWCGEHESVVIAIAGFSSSVFFLLGESVVLRRSMEAI